MGQLVNGVWDANPVFPTSKSGEFKRAAMLFRNWITADGSPGPTGTGGFKAESGRYHLYVSYACPWAHRTLIFLGLKDLAPHISFDVVHPDMLDEGWTFEIDAHGATGDRLFGSAFAREIYQRAAPDLTARVTVPILWDKEQGVIVSNESSEIIRMFNSAFDGITGNTADYWPGPLRDQIDQVNTRIYDTLNNGVYRCGFATTQRAYDSAVTALFDTMDWLEERLSSQRYLMGAYPTEADWRLATTLFRFDPVYHGHFKTSRNRLVDFTNLWAYARELYQWQGVAETVNFHHIRRHYHYSHNSVNPHRIVPVPPAIDWEAPHHRDRMTTAA